MQQPRERAGNASQSEWLQNLFTNECQYFQACYVGRYLLHSVGAIERPESSESLAFMRRTLSKQSQAPELDVSRHYTVMDSTTEIKFSPRFLARVNWPPVQYFDGHYSRLHLYLSVSIGKASETMHIEVTKPLLSKEGISCLMRDELSQIIAQDWQWPYNLPRETVLLEDEDLDKLLTLCQGAFRSQWAGDARLLPFPLHLAPARDTVSAEPCKSCDKLLMYEKVYAPVDESLAREIQLMTVNGFVKCMQASQYFCIPFMPSCPRLMRTLLLSVVWNSHSLDIDPCCWTKVSPERLVMVILRMLTWLRRDREVIQLLMQHVPRLREKFEVPFPVRWCGLMFDRELDVQSWLAVLVWVVETCSPKTLFVCLALVPASMLRTLVRTLDALFEDKDDATLVHKGAIYNAFVLNEYICCCKHSRHFEMGVFGKRCTIFPGKKSSEWLSKAMEVNSCLEPTGVVRHMRLIVCWFKYFLTLPEFERSCLRKNFFRRCMGRACAFMGLKDDIYMEEAYKLLFETMSQAPLVEHHICDLVECEMRNKKKSFQQRLWCMNIKLTVNEECLGKDHQLVRRNLKQMSERCGDFDEQVDENGGDIDVTRACDNVGSLIAKVAKFLLYPRIHGPELFAWTHAVASQLACDETMSPKQLITLMNEAYDLLKQIDGHRANKVELSLELFQ